MGDDALVDRAGTLVKNEQWSEALSVLAPYLATVPSDPHAWCLAANCQLQLDRLDDAVAAAGQALALDPDCEDGLRLTVAALGRKGLREEAKATSRRAVIRHPNSPRLNLQSAQLDVHDSTIDDSTLTGAQRAVDLDPGRVLAREILGIVLLHEGDRRRAQAEFAQAIKLAPDSTRPRVWLAVAQLRGYHLIAAARNLRAALDLDSAEPDVARNVWAIVFRWLSMLQFAVVLAAIALITPTAGHEVEVVVLVPHNRSHFGYEEVGAGRPAIMFFVLAAVLLVVAGSGLAISVGLGAQAARIAAGYLRRDHVLTVMAAGVAAGVGCLVLAAALGSNRAHDLVLACVVIVFVTSLGSTVVLRRTMRPKGVLTG